MRKNQAKKAAPKGAKPSSRRREWVKTAGVFALGAAAGSAVALLTAPASGKVTRKRIGIKIRSLKNATGRQLKQAKKLLSRKADDLRGAAAEKFGHTREWLSERIATNGNGKHARRVAAHS